MTSVAVVLVFCAFVSLSNSFCFHDLPKQGVKHCTDHTDNAQHSFGSVWTNSRCLRCVCSARGMDCCDRMGRPIIKTEGCVVKYDYTTCTFDVFHPQDPTIKCDYGAVGK